MRKRVEASMTPRDIGILLAEGNRGALKVIVEILNRATGFMDLLDLDDMGMRGPQIWVGYKDFAKCDLEFFIKAIRARDGRLIEVVNKECPDQKAVSGGASW